MLLYRLYWFCINFGGVGSFDSKYFSLVNILFNGRMLDY